MEGESVSADDGKVVIHRTAAPITTESPKYPEQPDLPLAIPGCVGNKSKSLKRLGSMLTTAVIVLFVLSSASGLFLAQAAERDTRPPAQPGTRVDGSSGSSPSALHPVVIAGARIE